MNISLYIKQKLQCCVLTKKREMCSKHIKKIEKQIKILQGNCPAYCRKRISCRPFCKRIYYHKGTYHNSNQKKPCPISNKISKLLNKKYQLETVVKTEKIKSKN